ncbi:hypothetical protein RUND412_003089 [Rhizina undulata]
MTNFTSKTELNKNWEFRQLTEPITEYRPVSQFPTNIHLDLLYHGLVPDPFLGKNELDVQWVGETDWVYRTTFPTPKIPSGGKCELYFEGLDTFARILVNSAVVAETDNMFLSHRIDVTKNLKEEAQENELVIIFKNAWAIGRSIVDEHPEHHWGCWNGDVSRLAVRKAQYHYGWDWGPKLLTCGPWRKVWLETFENRIEDIEITTTLDSTFSTAYVSITVELSSPLATSTSISLQIDTPDGKNLSCSYFEVTADARISAPIAIENPQLWYPHTYGDQPLYRLTATLGEGQHTVEKKFGIRSVKLVERKLVDAPGTTFFFEVNGIPVFCGGSNWIPADSFIPRISDERYVEWLKLIKDGGQVMVRVWAGGIYEQDIFYDTCDELGLLVWQDFAFGCGNYPAHIEAFRENVKKEAVYNVKRLRHHPCMAIWAGNNEDYQYVEGIPGKLGYDPQDQNPDNWLKSGFPARYLYEKVLKEVVEEFGSGVAYHFGSPWGGVDTRDLTVGDLHQWNVWHGAQEKYQNFDKLAGRFVSEFGMEAFPDASTIDGYLQGDTTERYPQSDTIDFHNKAEGHERRLALYLVENFRYAFTPLEAYIYSTQLLQAEALATAYRLWRRNWKGPGREYTAGALVWQINDCWPVTSWAIADYHLRPKYAYFAIKRELNNIVVGIRRNSVVSDGGVEEKMAVWAGSWECRKREVVVEVKAFGLDGRELGVRRWDVVLAGNRSVEVFDGRLIGWDGTRDGGRAVVVAAWVKEGGAVLARRVAWADPLKYVKTQKLKLEVVVQGDVVGLSSDVPVKGVVLKKEGVKWNDNFVDLVPGDVVKVAGEGLGGGEVGVRFYGGVF